LTSELIVWVLRVNPLMCIKGAAHPVRFNLRGLACLAA
jgi:hypothetical protein